MNLALRDIRHNLGRFLLTCFGVGLLFAVTLSMVGIYGGLVDDALSLARGMRADLWVVEAGTRGPFAAASRIPGDVREAVARVPGVIDAGSVTFQTVEARHAGGPQSGAPIPAEPGTEPDRMAEAGRSAVGQRVRLLVVGYEPGRPGGPSAIVAGRAIARGRGEMIADRASGLPVGSTAQMGDTVFRVVGHTAGAVSTAGDPLAWISLLDSQELQFRLAAPSARRQLAASGGVPALDTVNAVIARLSPNARIDDVSGTVRRWKHLAALTAAEQENVLTGSLVERARRQIGLFTTLLLIVSAVIVALIIYTLTMDKLREIATLKLIGAPDRTIAGMVLQQTLLLGLVGFIGGAALLIMVKDYFPRRVLLGWETFAGFSVLVMLICLLASLMSIRLALRVDPAQALGG